MELKYEDISPFELIPAMAMSFVEGKYPKEFYNPSYTRAIYELTNMVTEELVKKNYDVITKPYFDRFVSVKDLNCKWGDADTFTVPQI